MLSLVVVFNSQRPLKSVEHHREDINVHLIYRPPFWRTPYLYPPLTLPHLEIPINIHSYTLVGILPQKLRILDRDNHYFAAITITLYPDRHYWLPTAYECSFNQNSSLAQPFARQRFSYRPCLVSFLLPTPLPPRTTAPHCTCIDDLFLCFLRQTLSEKSACTCEYLPSTIAPNRRSISSNYCLSNYIQCHPSCAHISDPLPRRKGDNTVAKSFSLTI